MQATNSIREKKNFYNNCNLELSLFLIPKYIKYLLPIIALNIFYQFFYFYCGNCHIHKKKRNKFNERKQMLYLKKKRVIQITIVTKRENYAYLTEHK